MAESRSIEGIAVCGETAAFCRCVLAPGHDGPHVCNPGRCTGSWSGDYDTGAGFRIVRVPEPVVDHG